MIPMKTSTIFKSRWMALLWAAGIIWFAADYAGSKTPAPANNSTSASASTDSQTDAPDSDADNEAVQTALDALHAN